MVERTDTMMELRDSGGRGYHGGASTAASAMVRGRRGREAGEGGECQRARGGSGGSIPLTRTARGGSRAAGSCVVRAAAAVEHLPACLAEPSSSLERWL